MMLRRAKMDKKRWNNFQERNDPPISAFAKALIKGHDSELDVSNLAQNIADSLTLSKTKIEFIYKLTVDQAKSES